MSCPNLSDSNMGAMIPNGRPVYMTAEPEEKNVLSHAQILPSWVTVGPPTFTYNSPFHSAQGKAGVCVGSADGRAVALGALDGKAVGEIVAVAVGACVGRATGVGPEA